MAKVCEYQGRDGRQCYGHVTCEVLLSTKPGTTVQGRYFGQNYWVVVCDRCLYYLSEKVVKAQPNLTIKTRSFYKPKFYKKILVTLSYDRTQ